MKVAFVGCGYVFDIYMRTRWAYPELDIAGVFDLDLARSAVVSQHYGLKVFNSLEALLADPSIGVVVNLTSIGSHFEVSRQALNAGKHVYSEKPISTAMEQSRELFALAAAKGLVLAGAPSNFYSDAVGTMWKAVRDGAIGKPVLVYAELDDNPAHLMHLDQVRSPTGAPFPYAEEFQEGCTVEHIAYHLAWICGMFGPAVSVTAFSNFLVNKGTAEPLTPPDTPDFSVACLQLASGVSARITCTWVSPRDHRMRIIGDEGEISADNVFHDQSPVHLERFSRASLSARKAYTIRNQPLVGRRFGVGGRRLSLVRRWKSHAVEAERGVGWSLKHRLVSWLRRREVYAQDKILGIAEMLKAIQEGRPQPMSPDFLLHLNELSLLVQRAGPDGQAVKPTTSFEAVEPPQLTSERTRDYRAQYRPTMVERWMEGVVDAAHKQ
jgi:predicted dehydrogenase